MVHGNVFKELCVLDRESNAFGDDLIGQIKLFLILRAEEYEADAYDLLKYS